MIISRTACWMLSRGKLYESEVKRITEYFLNFSYHLEMCLGLLQGHFSSEELVYITC